MSTHSAFIARHCVAFNVHIVCHCYSHIVVSLSIWTCSDACLKICSMSFVSIFPVFFYIVILVLNEWQEFLVLFRQFFFSMGPVLLCLCAKIAFHRKQISFQITQKEVNIMKESSLTINWIPVKNGKHVCFSISIYEHETHSFGDSDETGLDDGHGPHPKHRKFQQFKV